MVYESLYTTLSFFQGLKPLTRLADPMQLHVDYYFRYFLMIIPLSVSK